MGSKSDWDTMRHAAEILSNFDVPHECRVVSAHRTPTDMAEYAASAGDRGLEAIIAGAGGSAHLPGMVAANFNGLFAPAGTPKPILDKITELTRTAMADEALQKTLIASGFEPVVDSGPEAAQKMVVDELTRWKPIMKDTGFKIE